MEKLSDRPLDDSNDSSNRERVDYVTIEQIYIYIYLVVVVTNGNNVFGSVCKSEFEAGTSSSGFT